MLLLRCWMMTTMMMTTIMSMAMVTRMMIVLHGYRRYRPALRGGCSSGSTRTIGYRGLYDQNRVFGYIILFLKKEHQNSIGNYLGP